MPSLTYYRDLVFLFGALRPAYLELDKQPQRAQAERNIANDDIFASTDRWKVAGAFDHHRIPEVPVGSIAYVGTDGNLYKVVQGRGRGVALTSQAVQDLGDRIAAFGYNADTMAQDPQILPHRGEWSVLEKVLHRNTPYYYGKKYAICASAESIRGCDPSLDGARTQTYEIGHPGAVGSKDSYGNVMKEMWVGMRITAKPAKWGALVTKYGTTGSTCSLYGEPPYGVFGVKYLETFRRLVDNKHADFDWELVFYGYSPRTGVRPSCVGPGVYVRPSATQYSLVDKGKAPGILAEK
jgi:hypothetical protein